MRRVGVYCCIPVQHLPPPYNTELNFSYVIDFLSPINPYPASPPAQCSISGGVAALWLHDFNMSGSLPSLGALAASLQVSGPDALLAQGSASRPD